MVEMGLKPYIEMGPYFLSKYRELPGWCLKHFYLDPIYVYSGSEVIGWELGIFEKLGEDSVWLPARPTDYLYAVACGMFNIEAKDIKVFAKKKERIDGNVYEMGMRVDEELLIGSGCSLISAGFDLYYKSYHHFMLYHLPSIVDLSDYIKDTYQDEHGELCIELDERYHASGIGKEKVHNMIQGEYSSHIKDLPIRRFMFDEPPALLRTADERYHGKIKLMESDAKIYSCQGHTYFHDNLIVGGNGNMAAGYSAVLGGSGNILGAGGGWASAEESRSITLNSELNNIKVWLDGEMQQKKSSTNLVWVDKTEI